MKILKSAKTLIVDDDMAVEITVSQIKTYVKFYELAVMGEYKPEHPVWKRLRSFSISSVRDLRLAVYHWTKCLGQLLTMCKDNSYDVS